MVPVRVETVENPEIFRELFSKEPARAAYLIGGLDPRLQEFSTWYAAMGAEGPVAVVFVYEGMSVPAVFGFGKAEDLSLILAQVRSMLPGRLQLQVDREHRKVWSEWFNLEGGRRMNRLSLVKRRFQPAIRKDIELEQLGHVNTAEILMLYTAHPDTYFEPYQLDSGLYYGVRDGGELMSVAGIHIVSKSENVAVLGNIMTAAKGRNRGFARACASKVSQELLEKVDLVLVDAPMENAAASHLLESLGFQKEFFFERVMVHR